MTPEGKIKKAVKDLLNEYKIYPASKAGAFPEDAAGWYYMPVQGGMGVSGIPDLLGHYHGVFWAVETKAPGKVPTGFQKLQIDSILKSGGDVFVIDEKDEIALAQFKAWLRATSMAMQKLDLLLENEDAL